MRVLVIHGPNLDLLGRRDPAVYGHTTLAEIDAMLATRAAARGAEVDCVQTALEGAIVSLVHSAIGRFDAIVINPGGYTHTSVAIRDALAAVAIPFIEVHLSNIHRREAFRHHSYLSELAVGVVAGLGPAGYRYALQYALEHAKPAA